jgi:ketosteroid isomerase-like protein
MSQENVEIVRAARDAYSHGDYDRVEGFHDPHIVVVTLEDGVVYGNDAVLANYKRWNEACERAEEIIEEVVGYGDRVFVAVHFQGRGRTRRRGGGAPGSQKTLSNPSSSVDFVASGTAPGRGCGGLPCGREGEPDSHSPEPCASRAPVSTPLRRFRAVLSGSDLA